MKRLLLASALCIGIIFNALSQCPNGITISTQAQIDSFTTNYPNCTEIPKWLIINGSDITDLSGLSEIVSVALDLQIKNTSLTSLTGLESIRTLSRDLIIENNAFLTDLSSINGITTISRNTRIFNNDSLNNLGDFNDLSIISGDLSIDNNDVLTSLAGLESITEITGNLEIKTNTLLSDISGLSNLTTIEGQLALIQNEALANLSGLENLNSIGDLNINNNDQLADLIGLQGLTSVGGFVNLESNEILSDITALEGITSIGTHLSISSNPSLISLAGVENLNSIGTYIKLSGNSSITTISEFNNLSGTIDYVQITGNPSLVEISGFNSITNLNGSPDFSGNIALTIISGFNNLITTSAISLVTNSLSTISGFNSLTTIDGDFSLGFYNTFFNRRGNPALSDLSGFSSLTTINGNFLSVDNDVLIDFSGLQKLETIEGDFRVFYNDKLKTFEGFDILNSIQGFVRITGNPVLESLSGFNQLETIGGTFGIYSNDSLVSLQALNRLTTVGGHFGVGIFESTTGPSLGANPVLKDLPLAQLVSVGGNFKVQNNLKITSLDNINRLESVEGELYIRGSAEMTSIAGFNMLTAVNDDITIESHASLNSISGFNSLITFGSTLSIAQNAVLTGISGFSILNSIDSDLLIKNNNILDNLTGFSQLQTINGDLSIAGTNPIPENFVTGLTNMEGFGSLVFIGGSFSVQGNKSLIDFTGLENLATIEGDFIIGAGNGGNTSAAGNDLLINFNGLQSLQKIGSRFDISYNNSLKNFYGLNSLTTINRAFSIFRNPELENLIGLEPIEHLPFSLKIADNVSLTSFTGLDNLKTVGELTLSVCPLIQDFTGLDALEEVNGHIVSPGIQPSGIFTISLSGITSAKGLSSLRLVDILSFGSCTNLISLDHGLESLDTINWLVIRGNNALQSLGNLESLEIIEVLELKNNSSLVNLVGLSNLSSANNIRIDNNDELLNLSGLESLNTLEILSLTSNDKLTDLSGIANYDHNTMTNLSIYFNEQLSVCNEVSICNYLALNGSSALIYQNAPGCDRAEIIESCNNGNNTISGQVTFDFDANGCDINDISMSNVPILITDGFSEYKTYTNTNGEYELFTSLGNFTTKAIFEDGVYMSLPLEQSVEFDTGGNTEIIDFCTTTNQTINDLNISIIPMVEARPGFNQTYRVIYENVGTTLLSGIIAFQFDESKQSFLGVLPNSIVSQTSNTITVDFSNLYPFENRSFSYTMNTLPPPTINDGDVLEFSASISSVDDITPKDNTFDLTQYVVNSFDPNDKTVLQGEIVNIDDVTEYLHYVIRFQNMGSASAINVSVKDILSDKLDWETFIPVTSSHSYKTRITNGNYVEFIFDNINLPAQLDDESGSNGLIAFKIKPRTDVVVNDIILGTADIFFDFNAPITTNTVSTKFTTALSVPHIDRATIAVYPVPSKGIIQIKPSNTTKINKAEVFSVNGSLLIEKKGHLDFINITHLSKGVYFLKIYSDRGQIIKRIIKN